MLGMRRERYISHGTQVQLAIKQAQLNNRAFLNNMAAAEATTGAAPTQSMPTHTHRTGAPHVYEVAHNDAIVALRAGDRMLIVDHADAKTGEFIRTVEVLMQKAHALRDKTPPWELETEIGQTGSRLKVHMAVDKTITMTYQKDANTSPVKVDPIGRLDWKL